MPRNPDDEIDTIGRSVADFEYKFSTNEPDGTFEGYGSVFNVRDSNNDVILPPAFDETLAAARRAGALPKMLLNHGMGSFGMGMSAEDMIPIGKWSKMSSDSHGLAVKGRLINLDTEVGRRIYGAMKEGELSGLSIGYIARDFIWGAAENDPRRTIKQLDLFEVSPVTFPGNVQAGVTDIKSAATKIATIREFEDFLRDVGGFSHAAAKRIAQSGFKSTDPRDEDGLYVVATLGRLAADISSPRS